MRQRLPLLLPLLFFMAACSSSKKIQSTAYLDEVTVKPESEYRASAARIHDLLHTVLKVRFDWQQQRLMGNAQLTLKPYAKPASVLELDAKGFDIIKVAKIEGSTFTELPYRYDSLRLAIELQKTYAENDTYGILIEYVAKPNELPQGGSAAITSDKGLYFINPLGREKNKPVQIWTQGETEAASCWFPTIDKPNERTTAEIYITVPDTLVTLSNGLLISSANNEDGTRTDYWKMDLPHAPYLFMMAVGDFAVVHDRWRGKAVDYYVEKAYAPYARDIFGNTPQMLDFFSRILGVEYPWQKYAQVCVRDYVSGAMENTTATIYFENMLQTRREMIDQDYEDIIAHELFHQWFGNYVTCESWSNLALNESLATYAEYLWMEHKYGTDMAEQHRTENLRHYLAEAWQYKRPIIDFHYGDKEYMFDAHSYSKGGLVLHMLRKYLGDTIFFRGLHLYLTENAFGSVEIHHLRLAMEEASGEDLNWFFNQWFFSAGHPRLSVDCSFNAEKSKVMVTIRQTQDENAFRLPMTVDIYTADSVYRETIVVERKEQTFEFAVSAQPLLVNADAEKYLLCELLENKQVKEWTFQYAHAAGYVNKREALLRLSALQEKEALAAETFMQALHDTFWGLRKLAVEHITLNEQTKALLAATAMKDAKPQVRAAAVARLGDTREDEFMEVYKLLLADSSLQVAANALAAIFELDKDEALRLAGHFEEFNTGSIVASVGVIYAAAGNDDKQHYFENKAYAVSGWVRYSVLTDYSDYLKTKSDSIIRKGIPTLEDIAMHAGSMWDRYAAAYALHELKEALDEHSENKKLNPEKRKELEKYLAATLENIIASEKNKNLLDRYKSFQ